MSQARILAVDDNPEIREILNILLTGEGFLVEEASDGLKALKKLKENFYDLIILDIMMPHMNGYQTCMEIRKLSNAPILFLSAKNQDGDKSLGFLSGGDDYLVKPFSYSELTGRVKALIRRYHVYKGKETIAEPEEEVIRLHGLEINPACREVKRDGKVLGLTDIEFEILLLLSKNRKRTFSADTLYEHIWNEEYYYGAGNTVMVHIRNLRKKIEKDPQNPEIVRTVWGRGYRCD